MNRQERYADFLRTLCAQSDTVCAVEFGAPDERVRDFLAQVDQLDATRTGIWLGTELLGHTRILRRFSANDRFLTAALKHTNRLGDWQTPFLEDLHAYRDQELVFASIVHEGDFWFEDGRAFDFAMIV